MPRLPPQTFKHRPDHKTQERLSPLPEQTTQPRAGRNTSPYRSGSPPPQPPAHGGPRSLSTRSPASGPGGVGGDMLQRKGKAPSPYSPSACHKHRLSAPASRRGSSSKTPPPELFAFPFTPPLAPAVPPSALPPRPSLAGGLGRSLRRGKAVPAPTRAAWYSGRRGQPNGTASGAPSLSGKDGRSASQRTDLPPAASARPLSGPAAPSCGVAGRRRRGSGSPRAAVGFSPHPRDTAGVSFGEGAVPRSHLPLTEAVVRTPAVPSAPSLPAPVPEHVQYSTS